MSSSNKIDMYRDFAAGVYLPPEGPEPHTPHYTLYTCTVDSILIHTVKGGGGEFNQNKG